MRCIEPESLGDQIVRWLLLNPDGVTGGEIADEFPSKSPENSLPYLLKDGRVTIGRRPGSTQRLYFATIKAVGTQRKLDVFVGVPA